MAFLLLMIGFFSKVYLTVTRVNEKNMIQKQLENIQNWLVQHAAKIANQSLNPAASIADIEQFEQRLSKHLPDDFKQL